MLHPAEPVKTCGMKSISRLDPIVLNQRFPEPGVGVRLPPGAPRLGSAGQRGVDEGTISKALEAAAILDQYYHGDLRRDIHL